MPVTVWAPQTPGAGADTGELTEIDIPNGVYLEYSDDKLIVLGVNKDIVAVFALNNICGAAYFDGVDQIRDAPAHEADRSDHSKAAPCSCRDGQ